jgi:hypothetical protein
MPSIETVQIVLKCSRLCRFQKAETAATPLVYGVGSPSVTADFLARKVAGSILKLFF